MFRPKVSLYPAKLQLISLFKISTLFLLCALGDVAGKSVNAEPLVLNDGAVSGAYDCPADQDQASGMPMLPGQPASSSSATQDQQAGVPARDGSYSAPATPQGARPGGSSSSGSNGAGNSVYVDQAGNQPSLQTGARGQTAPDPPEPLSDLQRLAQSSTGELLPIFGHDLFGSVPSTFAPGDQVAVTPDYVIGPGDDISLRIWGPETFNGLLTVDRSGNIYLPKAGPIHVAGLHFAELQTKISGDISRIYRNFDLSVNLGRLRSIQIYVVGEARHPGAYTVSSLSTVLNALFASGGPNVRGSLRHIQIRRFGQPVSEFDLYDFLLHGDKSKDVGLQTGDTIFIPVSGPQVALAGSVRHPAIYELAAQDTVDQLVTLAGGLSATGSTGQISLERISNDRSRQTMTVTLDASGRGMALRDGDVIFVNHITAAFTKSVSIRGNLANPGKFAWHEGMRLSDIIPDRASLLTTGYWQERNRLSVPLPLFEEAPTPISTATVLSAGTDENARDASHVLGNTPATLAATQQQQAVSDVSLSAKRNVIKIPAPEINWSYAVIERLDPQTLKNVLVPFNLGRLVQDHDPSQDLLLQPGDTVTILSQDDVQVPRDMQTKYIRLEGEFAASGVYSVEPNDTLADVVRRAGGLTSKAYLYGSSFTRNSARIFQQQRLDEYINSLSVDIERAAATQSATSVSGTTDPTAVVEQRLLIEQLRQLKATGRVVLEFNPESAGTAVIPSVPLENGDVFQVPSTPNTVSVVGAVYGQNVFLYTPARRLADYVALAGKPNRIADRKHAFIIRADGSIFSRERAQGTFSNSFDGTRINPGDSIVIPEKLIKPPILRDLVAYSQVLSSFGLAAAAINVVR